MDKKLVIQTIVEPNCKLIAIDNSEYDLGNNIKHFVFIDFLSYNDDKTPISKTINIYKEYVDRYNLVKRYSSKFVLDKDGTYYYYKLVIPTLNWFAKEDSEDCYKDLSKELFFIGNSLYFYESDDDDEHTLEEILLNSILIDNYIDAYNIVQNNLASQTFYCPKKIIFSVCKLQKCLIYLQKQLLFNNCGINNCDSTDNLKENRDFLLSAMYVFDYLKDIGNLTEAQRILDNLSSCDSVCGDMLNNSNNDCGCGNSI